MKFIFLGEGLNIDVWILTYERIRKYTLWKANKEVRNDKINLACYYTNEYEFSLTKCFLNFSISFWVSLYCTIKCRQFLQIMKNLSDLILHTKRTDSTTSRARCNLKHIVGVADCINHTFAWLFRHLVDGKLPKSPLFEVDRYCMVPTAFFYKTTKIPRLSFGK